jgi:hypothetical protein
MQFHRISSVDASRIPAEELHVIHAAEANRSSRLHRLRPILVITVPY